MAKPGFLILLLSVLGLCACTRGQPAYFYTVSEADLMILDETRNFFSDDSKWTRGDETNCDVDAEALTLFCALEKASFDVLDDFQLRRPALEEVRYAIDSMSDVALDRRILDFNNLETTDLQDIYKVLDIAKRRIQARLDAQAAAETGTVPEN